MTTGPRTHRTPRACGATATARLLAGALAFALLGAPAAAHTVEDAEPTPFESTVTRLEPATDIVRVTAEGGDSHLWLEAQPGHTVVILGYGSGGNDPEPYLRIDPDGSVHANLRSPAWYLNEDRYAAVPLPETADAAAEPLWQIVTSSGYHAAEWHDHRIHWMSPQPPPAVREDPNSRHVVFDWEVPILVDGEPVTIHGTLEWVPSTPPWVLVAAGLAIAFVVVVAARIIVARRDRRADAVAEAAEAPQDA